MNAMHRAVVLAILGAGASGAHADEYFRCGKWVISSSMTLGELVSKCGPPTSRTSRTEDVRMFNANTGHSVKIGTTTIETLTWTRGTRAAPMVVTVADGNIKSIERQP